jgi:putative nucleotidyltransferase with HDIG domain
LIIEGSYAILGWASMSDTNPTDPTPNAPPVSRIRKWLDGRAHAGRQEFSALQERIAAQQEQIRTLTADLESGKVRSLHLSILGEITENLKNNFDQPVAAQLVANAIQRGFSNELVSVFIYDSEHKEFISLAMAGNSRSFLPPSYHQDAAKGLIGRAFQARKTIVSNDTSRETDFIQLENQVVQSETVIPLIQNNQVKGMLLVDDTRPQAFGSLDVATLEIAAQQLVDAWERADDNHRLTELIQAGISLSATLEIQLVIDQIAANTRKTLEADFAFVTLLDREGSFTRSAHAGSAPLLLRALSKDLEKDPLVAQTMKSHQVLRIRDIRSFEFSAHLKSAHAEFTNLIAIPLRLHQLSIGAILVFGKIGQPAFSDSDESLSNLIATQATAAIESAWLYQELRSTLQSATLLYQLSIRIMQAEDLTQAARAIAETAFNFGHASLAGIVLFTPEHQIQAHVEVDADATRAGKSRPPKIIDQALQTGQTTVISEEHAACKICVPLQTPHRVYGALWLDMPDAQVYTSRYAANLQSLTNQAIVALERSILLVQTSDQTRQLAETYAELEKTYDETLIALTSALDARDRETEGHSTRVREIAARLGMELGLTPKQVKALERGALLHDIGKIGVSDSILLKPGPLTEDEWALMRQHPEIGARIVERVPFLSDTIPVMRYHHERWDGSGYPLGLAGNEIPLLARIFAIVDTYDALISDRPYRIKNVESEASEFVTAQSGQLFDPEIVSVFTDMLAKGRFNDILRIN